MTDARRLLVWPPAWQAGMKIGILSPSSPALYDFPKRTERARQKLEAVLEGRVGQLDERSDMMGYTAAKPEIIAESIHRMFLDEDLRLIVTAVGGFNTNSVLPYLDWALLRAHPTFVCGYSDASALLLAINSRARIGVLHGPALLPQWGDPAGPFDETVIGFCKSITIPTGTRSLRYAGFWCDPRTDWNETDRPASFHRKQRFNNPWRVLRPGTAQGALVGGNIETMNMLLGTPYSPSFSRKILFIEATGAEAYLPRFHRALTHLRIAGVLSKLSGLVVGRCPDAQPVAGVTLDDVLTDVLAGTGFPVIVDVDLGHTEPIITLPIGASAILIAEPANVSIRIDRP